MSITHAFSSAKSDGADSTVVQPSDWNAAHVIPDGYALMRVGTLTLTNDQIKALPTTAVQILAAPGSGKTHYVFGTFLHMNWVADYTNVNATASLNITNGQIWGIVQENVAGDLGLFLAGGGPDGVNTLMPTNGRVPASALAAQLNGYGGAYDSDIGNKPLNIDINNQGSGNLTGGNAGNSMEITVFYAVVDL